MSNLLNLYSSNNPHIYCKRVEFPILCKFEVEIFKEKCLKIINAQQNSYQNKSLKSNIKRNHKAFAAANTPPHLTLLTPL